MEFHASAAVQRAKLFRFSCICFLIVTICLLVIPASAQSASMSGLVMDPSGAAISKSQMTLVNEKTGSTQSTKTNNTGFYSFSFLQPGTYTLSAESEGFKKYEQTHITVSVAQNLAVEVRLQVGGTSQSVTVDGSGAYINTTDASVSTVIDRQFVENIPLNGRSFQSLISLVPGVAIVPSNQNVSGTGSYSGEYTVNGQRTESNYFSVDGVSSNTGTGGGNPGYGAGYSGSTPGLTLLGTTQSIVSIDALQEFRATTSTFSAQYGRTPGGQFSFETRSGTNDWHGSLFDYFRNDALDANNYFNNRLGTPRQAERQNDFGGTFGGPVRIPALYNGRDKTFFFFSYEGLRLTVPTAAREYTVPSVGIRQATVPAFQPFLNAFPIPNGPDMGNGAAYFIGAYAAPSSLDASSLRIDHQVNDRFKVFGRLAYTPSHVLARGSGDLAQINRSSANVKLLTLGATNLFTPRFSNEARFNITDNRSTNEAATFDNFGGATPLDLTHLPGTVDPSRPDFSMIIYYGAAFHYIQSLGQPFRQRQINAVDNLSFQVGRHNLKWGVDYRRLSNESGLNPVTQFGFFTSEAELLSGIPLYDALGKYFYNLKPVYTSFSAYGQDEWKINNRLSLSLGLRWELAPAPKDAGGHTPYTVTTTDLATMQLAPQNARLWSTTFGNFAPRFGLAYQIHQQPGHETVLRGGFGIFYDVSVVTATMGYYFGVGTSSTQYLYGIPFPATQSQFDAIPAPSTASPYTAAVYASDPNLKLPYAMEWNASLEQAFGQKQTLTLSYVGSAGRRLYLQKEYYPEDYGNQNFSLGNGVYLNTNGSSSDYNALQVQFNRKLSHGLQALLSTTWSHAFDDATTNFQVYTQQRAASDNDIRMNFQSAVTYDLPGRFTRRWLSTLASDWSLDTRISARSALPIDIIGNYGIDKNGAYLGFHPNRVSGAPLYINDPTAPGGRLINCEAFILTCDTSNLPEGEGNAGRNIARGFDAVQTDLAARKEFHLGDRLQMQFRVEALNLFNHPVYGNIDNLLTDGPPNTANVSGFGIANKTLNSTLGGLNPLYQVGGPRSLQLALRLHF